MFRRIETIPSDHFVYNKNIIKCKNVIDIRRKFNRSGLSFSYNLLNGSITNLFKVVSYLYILFNLIFTNIIALGRDQQSAFEYS